jgi:hypothetical protein
MGWGEKSEGLLGVRKRTSNIEHPTLNIEVEENEEAAFSKGERQRPAGCVLHLAGHLFIVAGSS